MNPLNRFSFCDNVVKAEIVRNIGQVEKLFVYVKNSIGFDILSIIDILGYYPVLINGDKNQYFIMANKNGDEIIN